MKNLSKKDNKSLFLNLKNGLLGLIWADIALLVFFILTEIDYRINYVSVYETSDLTRPTSGYVGLVALVILLIPAVVFLKKKEFKKASSLLFWEIISLISIILILTLV